MHREIELVLRNLGADEDIPSTISLHNADKLLNYIEDINLERNSIFELTPADSLYLQWCIGRWQIHIECLSNGKILYTFRKDDYGKAYGTASIDEFISLLEKYLLTGIC